MMPRSIGIPEMKLERPCSAGARSYNLPPANGAEATERGLAVICPTTTGFQRKIEDATGIVNRFFCGCSSGVEHNVANVVVVGSNPITRFSV